MLYIFHGADRNSTRDRAKKFVDAFLKKKEDAVYYRFSLDEEFNINDLCRTQGLFESKNVVFFDETEFDFEPHLKEMTESHNAFIIFEGKIKVGAIRKAEKLGATVEKFDKPKLEDKFNPFDLTDAIGQRNREKVFILLEKARSFSSVSPEEIIRPIEWYFRSLILCKDSNSAEAAGLNPYVFRKAKKASELFKEEELKNFIKELNMSVVKSREANASSLWIYLYRLIVKL